MQKKILSIILCMILCILPLSGCKKNVGTPEDNAVSPEEEKQEETEVYTFGYTCTTMADNPYFAVLEEAIREEVENQGGQMITRDPKGDDTLQLEQINEMIEEGIDAIFLSPVNWETIQPGLDALREAGVKIINIDTEVKDLNLVDAYVGTDNKQAGYLCGEDVVQRFPEGGKVLILECPNTNSINERITGFEEAIADQGFEIIARENVNGSKEISMETTKRLLKQYPDVDVIMCGNDQTALGAKVAAETDQAYAGVVIYGVDGSPDLKKELQKSDDIIVGTAAQRPITLGKDAVKSAFQVLDGEKIKEPIYEETFLITKDNVDMYGADGWQ